MLFERPWHSCLGSRFDEAEALGAEGGGGETEEDGRLHLPLRRGSLLRLLLQGLQHVSRWECESLEGPKGSVGVGGPKGSGGLKGSMGCGDPKSVGCGDPRGLYVWGTQGVRGGTQGAHGVWGPKESVGCGDPRGLWGVGTQGVCMCGGPKGSGGGLKGPMGCGDPKSLWGVGT